MILTRSVRTFAAAVLFAACGGSAAVATATPNTNQATSSPTATSNPPAASATAAPTASSAATPSAGAVTWTVASSSKATVSVREQLVGVSLPSDAVLVASGAAGSFTLNPDLSFSSSSKITFDLTTLTSDSRDRDNFVKQDTINTRQFPTATFVPKSISGLSSLPASGTFTFKLSGDLTVHGTTKAVTFDVSATRSGADLKATATLAPTVKFADLGMRAPSVPFRVVSVVDEIRIVVELVATGAAA